LHYQHRNNNCEDQYHTGDPAVLPNSVDISQVAIYTAKDAAIHANDLLLAALDNGIVGVDTASFHCVMDA